MKRDSLSQTSGYIKAMPYMEIGLSNKLLLPLLIPPNPIKDKFHLELNHGHCDA